MVRLAVVLLVSAAALLAGCGESARDPAANPVGSSIEDTAPDVDAAAASAGRQRASRRGRKVTVVSSQFGTILADGRGQALYYFGKEGSAESECYGACARAWPPVLTKGRPVAGKRVRKRLLGTTPRRGGKRQVTYRGRPLYYYVDDSPGQVLCHNVHEFGGLWRVIEPDGMPVR